ncbi:MAG: DUF4340 domain-containing protein [Hespellia sp.]|nr:DUF4340 domain-containing protein [Hespellia sp.]
MAEKKKKQLLSLIGIFAVLLICYIGITIYADKKEEKESEEAKASTIYMTDISDVEAITYQGGTDTLSFKKNEDGEWYSTDDKEFPLNAETVENIVSVYSKLEAERELKGGDDISAYGLDEPTYYVTMTDSDGGETTVNIGNAAEDDYYAMVAGESTAYTIAADKITDLQTPLTDMAALDEFPHIASGNLVSEEIKTGGGKTKYESDNDDDSENIAAVAGGLGALSLDTPVDYHMADADASKYGLDEASRTTVTAVYTKDDAKQTVILYLGSEDGSGNRYVQLDGSKIVYTVTTEICNNILNVSDGTEDSAE